MLFGNGKIPTNPQLNAVLSRERGHCVAFKWMGKLQFKGHLQGCETVWHVLALLKLFFFFQANYYFLWLNLLPSILEVCSSRLDVTGGEALATPGELGAGKVCTPEVRTSLHFAVQSHKIKMQSGHLCI